MGLELSDHRCLEGSPQHCAVRDLVGHWSGWGEHTGLIGLGSCFSSFLRVLRALYEVGGVRATAVCALELFRSEVFLAFMRVVSSCTFHAFGVEVAVATTMAELEAVVALGGP